MTVYADAAEIPAGEHRHDRHPDAPCDSCGGRPSRPYIQGRRCDGHVPEVTPVPPERPVDWASIRTPAARADYPDLSHGQPGHMCLLSGAGRQLQPEAGQ